LRRNRGRNYSGHLPDSGQVRTAWALESVSVSVRVVSVLAVSVVVVSVLAVSAAPGASVGPALA
jgi:hypothetical protein